MKMRKIKGKRIPIRLPLPEKTGGVHKPKKGVYNRQRDRKDAVREWQTTQPDKENIS